MKILNIRKEKNQLVEELTNIDLATKKKIDKAIEDKEAEFKKEKERLQADYEINLQARTDEIKKQNDEEIKEFNIKENEFRTLIQELSDEHSVEIKNKDAEIINLKNQLLEYAKKLDKLQTYEDAHNQKNELLKLREREILKDFSIDEIKFLKIIYKNNLDDKVALSSYINSVLSVDKSLKKIAIEKILTDLKVKGFFMSNQYNEISYTSKLKTILYSAFNEQEI